MCSTSPKITCELETTMEDQTEQAAPAADSAAAPVEQAPAEPVGEPAGAAEPAPAGEDATHEEPAAEPASAEPAADGDGAPEGDHAAESAAEIATEVKPAEEPAPVTEAVPASAATASPAAIPAGAKQDAEQVAAASTVEAISLRVGQWFAGIEHKLSVEEQKVLADLRAEVVSLEGKAHDEIKAFEQRVAELATSLKAKYK